MYKCCLHYIGITCSERNGEFRVTGIDRKSQGLTGELPSQIGDLEYLQNLKLDNNMLNSTLPSEIGKCSRLTHFYTSENPLIGMYYTACFLNTLYHFNIFLYQRL